MLNQRQTSFCMKLIEIFKQERNNSITKISNLCIMFYWTKSSIHHREIFIVFTNNNWQSIHPPTYNKSIFLQLQAQFKLRTLRESHERHLPNTLDSMIHHLTRLLKQYMFVKLAMISKYSFKHSSLWFLFLKTFCAS